jgi:hypothetical protein
VAHDCRLGAPGTGRRGGEAGAQRVTGEIARDVASAARSRTIVAMAVGGQTRADVAIDAPEHDVAGTRGAADVKPGFFDARFTRCE